MDKIINTDWMAFSVKLMQRTQNDYQEHFGFTAPRGCVLKELKGTNLFARRILCYSTRGELILTLLAEPHSHIIDHAVCLVELANRWLYCGDISWVWPLVFDIHPCSFLSMSRCDFAADFELTPERAEIVEGLLANKYYIAGKREGCHFVDYSNSKSSSSTSVSMSARQLSWGSKHSNTKWKLYNKSLELAHLAEEGKPKQYIIEHWEKEGYNLANVWRLEVSISPMSKYEFKGAVTLERMNNWFFVNDLYTAEYCHRWICRENQGHKDKTNDRRVYLFPAETQDRVEVKPPKNELGTIDYINGLRAAMRQRTLPEVQVNARMLALWTDTARKCVEIGGLQNYFLKTWGVTIDMIDTITD